MYYKKKLKKKTVKKMIIYSNEDLEIIKNYKISSKVKFANSRFSTDKISSHDVLMVLKRYSFRCLYCDDRLKPETWQLDHFYAKASGGKNRDENLAPACKWCNLMKNALDGYAFLHKCKVISENNFFKKALMNDYYEPVTNQKRLEIIERRKNESNQL